MTTTHKHWTAFWLAWAVWLITSVAISRADTLQLRISSAFPQSQQVMAWRVQALFGDKIVADRGLSASENVMHVTLQSVYIDGAPPESNVWAQSYASLWTGNNQGKYVFAGGAGRIDFDSANHFFWTDEVFSWVLFHELCHFFGFQTPIWRANGCLGVQDTDYTGAAGLAAYTIERNAAATFVPVADNHFAQSLQPWLMTPSLSGSYVSRTAVQIFKDNGNTLTPWAEAFQGGSLASILPRRGLRPVIVFTP